MGRAVPLEGGTVVVGTDRACGLVLTDERVSARHVEVRRGADGFVLRDLGSTNGTHYEGSRITEVSVGVGATLKVGRTFLRIQQQPRPVDVAPSRSRRFGELVAESLAMREVFAVLELAARSDATVLVQGETGTGKELVARALHEASGRRQGPFVAVDCGALPEGLIESELFGHVRGAFTGASERRQGAFVRASGGTLFLDELATVPLPVQARLLRALEERRVRPVGSDEEREIDVRIVAASTADLSARVADGSFRPDLYYRLSVICVSLPPLRARREDIPPIVRALLRGRGFEGEPVAGPNLDRLMAHDWLGNVRELRNVVDRALALSPGAKRFDELRIQVPAGGLEQGLEVRSELPFKMAKEAVNEGFERRYLKDLLARSDGNISAAARAAELDRKHLRALLRKHGLLVGSDGGE